MNIATTDLTDGKNVNYYIGLARKIMKEFPELSDLFDDIKIVSAYSFQFRDGTVDKISEDFLKEKTKYGLGIREEQLGRSVRSMGKRKFCIELVVDNLKNQPEWRCQLFFRHEFCHGIDENRTDKAISFQKLKERFGIDFALHLREYLREYRAWKCVQRRYGSNELVRFLEVSALSRKKKRAKSPEDDYKNAGKQNTKMAILVGLLYSLEQLCVLYLFESLPGSMKNIPLTKEDVKERRRFLRAIWRCMKEDTRNKMPFLANWVKPEHFDDYEIFYRRFVDLFELIEI